MLLLRLLRPTRGAGGLLPSYCRWFSSSITANKDLPSAVRSSTTRRTLQRPPLNELIAPLAHFLGRTGPLVPGQVLDLSKAQLVTLLTTQDPKLEKALFEFADASTERVFGNDVICRGIVEFSNVCIKDCLYCGIRKHMKIHRYTMSKEEILSCAEFAMEQGMGTLMMQSGELPTPARIEWMLDMIRAIRQRTVEMDVKKKFGRTSITQDDLDKRRQLGLAVALSLGELPESVYRSFYEAGAHRYLLRIETSNPELYTKIHPSTHSFATRLKCLHNLKKIGYEVGTGVMIGLPYQTVEDMAGDLLFFKDFQPDMIGMGPYIVQHDTPLGQQWLAERVHATPQELQEEKTRLLNLTTRMYALARVMLGDVNIAATTALEALDPTGREIALRRGSNVVMPIITPQRLRKSYQLYEGKPCIDEDSVKCAGCMSLRVKLVGKHYVTDSGWHDPPHAHHYREQQPPQTTSSQPSSSAATTTTSSSS